MALLEPNGAIETDHIAFRKRFGDRDYLRSTKQRKVEQMPSIPIMPQFPSQSARSLHPLDAMRGCYWI